MIISESLTHLWSLLCLPTLLLYLANITLLDNIEKQSYCINDTDVRFCPLPNLNFARACLKIDISQCVVNMTWLVHMWEFQLQCPFTVIFSYKDQVQTHQCSWHLATLMHGVGEGWYAGPCVFMLAVSCSLINSVPYANIFLSSQSFVHYANCFDMHLREEDANGCQVAVFGPTINMLMNSFSCQFLFIRTWVSWLIHLQTGRSCLGGWRMCVKSDNYYYCHTQNVPINIKPLRLMK